LPFCWPLSDSNCNQRPRSMPRFFVERVLPRLSEVRLFGEPAGSGVDQRGSARTSGSIAPPGQQHLAPLPAAVAAARPDGLTGAAATGTPCCMARSVRAGACSGSSRCMWGLAAQIDPNAYSAPPEKAGGGAAPGQGSSEHPHLGLRPEHPLLIRGQDQGLITGHVVRLC
jgi:hypothetical protein